MGRPMRKQIRLPDYDYSSPGAYFVTICTHEKRRILSSIPVGALHEAPAVRLSGAGVIVRRIISCLPSRYPAAKDGAFNLKELARLCDISRTTAYKYIGLLEG